MKEQIQAKFDEDGVSPVIGVILMVAVTVALVALVTVIVFDIGGDVSESPDATVDLGSDGDNVTATVLRNENVESFNTSVSYNESLSGSTTYYYTSSGSSGTEFVVPDDLEASSVGDTVKINGTIYKDGSGDGTYDPTQTGDYPVTLDTGSQVQILATMSDGSEQVLTTTTYDG